VANAVAAAVIANEHHNHLNSLKSRFQPASSGEVKCPEKWENQ